ncbi:MAG: Ntn hydrolase family protein [Candidatus Humimicrobiaceae bacterium]
MTMVVVGKFKDGVVIISDSRASYEYPGKLIPNDSLQKILPIGKNRVFCYSGSVYIANKAIERFRILNKQKKEYQYLDGIIKKLPGLLKSVFDISSLQEKNLGLSVIVGGKMLSGNLKFWVLHHPNFVAKPIDSHCVIGSGSVVKAYLDKEINNIRTLPDLKTKADKLVIGLSSELSKYGVDSVGGMFQIVLISKSGIQILNHGFIDMDPEAPPNSVYMNMQNGQWVQHDLTKGKEIPIVDPSTLLIQQISEKRVRDYIPPDFSKKESKWHLNYFLTSVGVHIEPDKIEFHHPIVSIGSYEFPIVCSMTACIGFWGSSGRNNLKLILEKDDKKEVLGEVPFDTEYFPEGIDIQIQLNLVIEKPGPVFLEARIREKLFARRVLYFGKVEGNEPKTDEEKKTLIERVEKQLQANLIKQVDILVENGKPQLVYFFLCQDYKNENNIESFLNQFWVSYWKQYPLSLYCYIASAFRIAAGKHDIRIDLVNAANRNASVITNTSVKSKSSCLISPVHGRFIIQIPEPGYYFINTYVDEALIASCILIAETDEPKFSYNLKPEQLYQVQKGLRRESR